jgi:hypothetical protein
MALPGSGQIRASDIKTEWNANGSLAGLTQVSMGYFLTDGAVNLPTSGSIRMSDFYNIVARSTTITTNTSTSRAYFRRANVYRYYSINMGYPGQPPTGYYWQTQTGSIGKKTGLVNFVASGSNGARDVVQVEAYQYPAPGTPSFQVFTAPSVFTTTPANNVSTSGLGSVYLTNTLPYSSATTKSSVVGVQQKLEYSAQINSSTLSTYQTVSPYAGYGVLEQWYWNAGGTPAPYMPNMAQYMFSNGPGPYIVFFDGY